MLVTKAKQKKTKRAGKVTNANMIKSRPKPVRNLSILSDTAHKTSDSKTIT